MKKRKSICTYLLIVVMALTSILLPVSVDAASKVKISKTKVTLEEGKSITLKVTGTKNKITWKTSNKDYVAVSSKGKITAKKVGKATITATVNKKKYTCKVTVISNKSEEKDTEKDKEESNKVEKDSNGYWEPTEYGNVVWSGTNSKKSGTIGKFSWKVGTGIRVNGYTIYSMPWAENYEGEIEDIAYDVDNAIKKYNIPSANDMSGEECLKWIIDNYDSINKHKDEYGFDIAVFALGDKGSRDRVSKENLEKIGWSEKYGDIVSRIDSNFTNGTTHNKY